MKTHLLLLFSVLLLPNTKGDLPLAYIWDVPTSEPPCFGSVILYEGSKETVVTNDEDKVKVTVDKVRLEGCGCFTLHSLKNGRGRSYFLRRTGEHTAEEIGWSRVRSVRRVECDWDWV